MDFGGRREVRGSIRGKLQHLVQEGLPKVLMEGAVMESALRALAAPVRARRGVEVEVGLAAGSEVHVAEEPHELIGGMQLGRVEKREQPGGDQAHIGSR